MATIQTLYDTDGNTISTVYDVQSISVGGGGGGGISNVVEDTTPQLGGNLDLNSNDITGTGNITHTGTLTTTGNIAVTGTVDGRDVATDGTKLDGIASGAQVNTVDSVNSATGVVVLDADDISDTSTTNKFTTASDISKLAGIEANATADQTGAEIKVAYEAELNTNAFTDADHSKLDGIAAGAEVNTVDSVNTKTGAVVINPDDLDDTSTTNKFTTAADISKLAGIEASATTDQSDVEIETAYNNQVAQVSGGEVTAGTETAIRRYSPADVKSFVDTHSAGAAYFLGTCTATTTLTASTWTDVPINTEIQKDTGFTHSASSAEVTLDNTAVYLLTATLRVDSPGRVDVHINMSLDTGAGYSIYRYGKFPILFDTTPAFDIDNITMSIPYSATSGDKVKFQIYTEDSTVDLSNSDFIFTKI
jgi:hypothetical protein